MPWCEPCGRYLAPSTVNPDGTCPACGGTVESAGAVKPTDRAPVVDTARGASGIPWHFWVVLVLTAVYLGWRLVQGVALLF